MTANRQRLSVRLRALRLCWLLTGGAALGLIGSFSAPIEAHAQDRDKPRSKKKKKKKRNKRRQRAKPRKKRQGRARGGSRGRSERGPEASDAPRSEAGAADADADVVREGDKEVKVMSFSGLDIEGRLKSPQMLYFVNRVRAEFDRPRLPHRSFMPELKRSTEGDALK